MRVRSQSNAAFQSRRVGAASGACCFSDSVCSELDADTCTAQGGTYQGELVSCAAAAAACATLIPAVGQWGLIVLALLLLTAGTIVIRRVSAMRVAL
ncbi:MAG: IPTL-CTERM sorting domain-containing protein [Phycisphaerales bacterium]|nr:IPTL-CTERM sorting domain-containing protein [Phycisphaerales bacterium]NNM27446.1 IPTL-CTERM sorting domain-containing protein [Phycisphaerales bacterium]